MSDQTRPHVVVIGGPNGAGKSTSAARLLPTMGVTRFVNADVIARGLSAFRPEAEAMKAGRIMLEQLRDLVAAREDFAFETTLSGRRFATSIAEWKRSGYFVTLVYYWIPSPDLSIARVAHRVRAGGHHVPDDDVRRRYERGVRNFFNLYRPLADRWEFIDNSKLPGGRMVASFDESGGTIVQDQKLWAVLLQRYTDGQP